MTKDEAIKIIKTEMECVSRPDCDRLACAYCDLAMRDEDVLTAYQMAVDALQTDGDCISKQTVFDTAAEYENELCEILGENELAEVVKILKHRLIALPSAHPEPCDAISRADAIRVASGYCHPANVAKELAKLPSVQQEEAIPVAWLEEQAKWFESRDNAFAKIEANNIRVMIKKWRSEKDERPD